jgi:hypothetical protein
MKRASHHQWLSVLGKGTLGIILLCIAPVIPALGAEKLKRADIYRITFQPEVPLEKVEVSYGLTGKFGGFYGQWRYHTGSRSGVIPAMGGMIAPVNVPPPEENPHTVLMPTKGAKTFKGAIYCPGYEFAIVDEPSLADSKRGTSVLLKKLPMLRLDGRLEGYRPATGKELVVDMRYQAAWVMGLHNRIDGFVPTFHVATVRLRPDGTFSMEVPDFFRDPSVPKGDLYAHSLELTIRDKKTWNPMFSFSEGGTKLPLKTLKIRPSYEDAIVLQAEPR